MGVNRYQNHVFVLPEDDANRQLANGFMLEANNSHKVQILREVGGWQRVCEVFLADHVGPMRSYARRYFILLLDFDDDSQRARKVANKVPEDLRDRVFLLGVRPEPEALKQAGLGSYEEIGRKLATECRTKTDVIWGNEFLRQNAEELSRLRETVRDLIF